MPEPLLLGRFVLPIPLQRQKRFPGAGFPDPDPGAIAGRDQLTVGAKRHRCIAGPTGTRVDRLGHTGTGGKLRRPDIPHVDDAVIADRR